MSENQETKRTGKSDILEVARQRFNLAVEAESEIRSEALDDLRFRAGEQWPEQIKSQREAEKKPCLIVNRLPQTIRQVTNDQRQNRPSIKVSPVDDQADDETAKVLQGLIRHIEYNSNADVAYDTAFEGAVCKGIGYLRVVTDYCDPFSFDQEILIKRVRNSFSVYLDPHCQEPDGSDASWGFIFEDISHDDYRAKYPNSELASMKEWTSIGDNVSGWIDEKTVRIAEYFYKTFKETTLVLLSDKSVVEKDKLPPVLPEGVTIVSERKSTLPAIKWAKMNAVEILEETDWPGIWIPIIPVIGDELDVDGKRILEGIIRHAKDPMRMYNYWVSSETETIALAPKAPWLVTPKQIEGYEGIWQTANTKNHAYLPFNPIPTAPPPSRNAFEPPVQAITNARMQAAEDLKSTTGIYDASLGARSNETSGIAIQRRNLQAQTSNFHFVDNLSRALRHLGRIVVDLIPKVYDTPRTVRILGEDGQAEMVAINQVFEKNGQPASHFLGHGKYDVTVTTGPSYATKRQEAVASMLDLTRAYPMIAQIAGDLMVRNMDWPGAQDIAERLKKTLPPGLAEDKDEEKQPLPPEAQAQMQQMSQLIEQLTQSLNEANQKLETKAMELESRERIEFAKIQTNVELEMAKMGSVESLALLKAELDQINRRLDLVGMNEPIDPGIEGGPEEMAEQPPMGQPIPGQEQFDFEAGPIAEVDGLGAMAQMNQPPTDGLTSGQLMGE